MASVVAAASPNGSDAGSVSQSQRGFEDLGLRFIVGAGNGEPANDMMGRGVFARYRLDADWLLGGAVDEFVFDFEGPAALLGLQQSLAVDTIDTDATRTSITIWAERELGGDDRWLQPFALFGGGVGLMDADDVTGPLEGGGTFDITTDPGTEFLLFAGLGVRARLARHVTLEVAARADYHLADWKLLDRVSNREAKIGSYHAIGGYVGLTWRF
jgi:hypothetical protein